MPSQMQTAVRGESGYGPRSYLDQARTLIGRQIAPLPVTFLKGRNGWERAKECDPRHIAGSALPICEPSPRYLGNGTAGYVQD